MDPRLLRAYNDELIYLRETAREFGEEYESVAGRLGLSTPTEVDPYVERLLEGVAFLAARVNLAAQGPVSRNSPSTCCRRFQPSLPGPHATVDVRGRLRTASRPATRR